MDLDQSQKQENYLIERADFQSLFDALAQRGYRLIGPTVRDQVILYDELKKVEELPIGWTDEQEAGTYRLKRRKDGALFGYVVGLRSWKQFFFPPKKRLWRAQRGERGFVVIPEEDQPEKLALLAVRACELAAIAIQDRVFCENEYIDPGYQAQRHETFIVALNCGVAGGTCFCASMNSGPQATKGFDLALTELLEGERHYFLVEIGSETGRAALRDVPHQTATVEEKRKAKELLAQTSKKMGRSLETKGLRERLQNSEEHLHWEEVAKRCMSCANCTLVCPTCFCSSVEDFTDLTGKRAERWRKWDSCFTMDFSYIHGGNVRSSVKSRYRQWVTHKLSTWFDQFVTSGCVGCGRCITWCPVGIDITEEAKAIAENSS